MEWMKINQEEANVLYEKLLVMEGFGDLVFNLILMAVIPALSEEVLFRGGLQQLAQRYMNNVHLAVWVTAITFSLIHFQFLTFIPRVIMGAGLGYIFVWGGSLWMPIIAHAINNGIAILITYLLKNNSGLKELDQIGQSLDVWVIGSTCLTFGLFFCLRKLSKQKTQT